MVHKALICNVKVTPNILLAYKLPNSERQEAALLVEKDLPCAHREEQAPHPPHLKFGGFE